jgi:hypothetical protein
MSTGVGDSRSCALSVLADQNEADMSEATNQAECIVCLKTYLPQGPMSPMVLICGHSCCYECCLSIENKETGTWPCPSRCLEVTREDPRLNLSLVEQLQPPVSGPVRYPTGVQCGNCFNDDATVHCAQCRGSMCSDCSETVHAMPMMKGHTLCGVNEAIHSYTCPVHNEPLKYMCLDCRVVTCTDCREFGKHRGHAHDLLANVAEECREQLRTLMSTLVSMEESTASVGREVEQVAAMIVSTTTAGGPQGESSATSGTAAEAEQLIEVHFNGLQVALEVRRALLLAEVRQDKAHRLSQLEEQYQSLTNQWRYIHATQADILVATEVSV